MSDLVHSTQQQLSANNRYEQQQPEDEMQLESPKFTDIEQLVY